MKLVSKNTSIVLAICVVLLMVLPLALVKGKFEGSDDQGSAAVAASVPGFKPWFHPIWEPPSAEIESLLFALQAAIGAGTIGYVLGRIQGAAKAREASKGGEQTETEKKPARVAH